MPWLTDPRTWASLATLVVLETVLGVDNLVFLALLTGRLPEARRATARRTGLGLALIARLALLVSVVWLTGLSRPLLQLFGHAVSLRDIVLIGGGLFLIYKGTREIHQRLDAAASAPAARPEGSVRSGARAVSFPATIVQIVALDIVFSLDSVLTAVGMASNLWVMAAAIIIAMAIMLMTVQGLAAFIEKHPSVTMLALSFLLLIGMTLIADGAGFDVPKGYVYAAVGFSVCVEALNQFADRRRRLKGRGATG